MKRVYRMPDGNETTDADAYISAWQDLLAPIEALTGLQHCAFDPGAVLIAKDGPPVTLPVWFIQLINQGLDRLGYLTTEKENQ